MKSTFISLVWNLIYFLILIEGFYFHNALKWKFSLFKEQNSATVLKVSHEQSQMLEKKALCDSYF
jgi:hypothetical protein